MVYEQSGREQFGGSSAGSGGYGQYGGSRSGMSGKVSDARKFVSDKTSQVSRQVQETAHKAQDWVTDTVDEYPLAVGGACLVLGMAVGFALPTSKSERQYIGKAGRRVMDQAQEVGSKIIDKGEKVAERAVEAMKSTVKKNQGGGNSDEFNRKGNNKQRQGQSQSQSGA